MKVLIIGGGAIGLSCAYYLGRAGVSVTLVDQCDLGREASWAGAGMILAQGLSSARTPLQRLKERGAELFPKLSAELRELTGIDNGYRCCGALELQNSSRGEGQGKVSVSRGTNSLSVDRTSPHQETAEALDGEDSLSDGFSSSVVLGSELRALEPNLNPAISAAVLFPASAQVRNPWHLRALMAACSRFGVDLRPGCPVFTLRRRGERITEAVTTIGSLTADQFLVCAGAWSGGLLDSLGVTVPVRPVRGQIALLRGRPGLIRHLILRGQRYLVPRDDGRVLVGSTEEEAGFDKQTSAKAIQELLAMAVELVPALAEVGVERCWAGLRPASQDRKPILGVVSGFENLLVATGHFRSGLQLSAISGILIKQLLLKEKPEEDLTPFRVDRF